MARVRHLVDALTQPGFRRLLASRLTGQFGDGVFQASLAGAVLFNPERQAHATDVAAGFAVLLLPYSLVGPFAGVLLDRWWRQRVLVHANALRAVGVLGLAAGIAAGLSGVPFYASALVILSISRFVLSALSAALPRLISGAELVTANAISATAGTIATALGGGLAIVVRSFSGASNDRYAVIAAAAAIPYLAASVVARRFARRALGPTEEERRARSTPAQVVHGLVAGARQIRSTAGVGPALLTIAGHRLAYGIWTVCTLLLYRNHFSDDGFFRAGLAGLGQVLVMVAIGGGAAALVTPSAFRRLGPHRWVAAMLLIAAAFELVLVLPYRKPLAVVAGLVLGFTAQAVKISVDTVIQQRMPDRYRGRVFTIYDMLFNVALVLAATITALFLPEDGHAPAAAVAVGVGWAVLGLGYLRSSPRTTS